MSVSQPKVTSLARRKVEAVKDELEVEEEDLRATLCFIEMYHAQGTCLLPAHPSAPSQCGAVTSQC